MRRTEFTEKIARIILEMIEAGENPMLDEVKRGDIQQTFYFLTKKSKLDGINRRSRHQYGKAFDLYFIDKQGKIDMNMERYEKWHDIWEKKYGGEPMITWDLPHFQVPIKNEPKLRTDVQPSCDDEG